MGLVDLRTNLKSLRYGKDTVGGGNSAQPFVTRKIPDDLSDVGRTGGPDFLLRGGTLLPRIVLNDATRISKLFYPGRGGKINTTNADDPLGVDASNNGRRPVNLIGTLFTAKQNILSLSNVSSQAGYVPFKQGEAEEPQERSAIGQFIKDNIALNQGLYTPLSTIGQTVGNALGIHLNKQGLNPLKNTTLGSPDGNTPLGLPTYLNTIATDGTEGNKSRLFGLIDKVNTNNQGVNTLYSYSGGPGATLGVGKTTLNMLSDQRTGINNPYTRISLAGPSYGTSSYISGFRSVPNFSAISYNMQNPDSPFPLSETRTVPVNGERETINYLGPNKNLSPTVNNDNLSDKLKNDKLYRIGASAAFYSNSKIFRQTEDNTKYFIDPFFNTFDGNGATKYYGIYDTTLNPYSLETKADNKAFRSGISKSVPRQVWTQQEIESNIPYSKTNDANDIKDFRRKITDNGNQIPNSLPYDNKNKFNKRVNLGDPGKKGNISSYSIGKRDADTNSPNTIVGNSTYIHALDEVNAYPLYQSKNVTADKTKNDFVKFRIGIIDNNNPTLKTYIHFRAIIDNMSDAYTAGWDAIKYMGRGENFYKYKGFDRTISLGWTVAAQSKQELIPQYQKLNYLASSLAPNYSDIGYMRGNLITLTIGGWCYEQPGVLEGLTLTVPEESPWEIAIPDGPNFGTVGEEGNEIATDTSVKEMPMICKVSGFNFKPIHNFIPQLQSNSYKGNNGFISKYGQERFIALNNGYNDNYSDVNYIPD